MDTVNKVEEHLFIPSFIIMSRNHKDGSHQQSKVINKAISRSAPRNALNEDLSVSLQLGVGNLRDRCDNTLVEQ